MNTDEMKALRKQLIPVRNRMTALLNTVTAALDEPDNDAIHGSVKRQLAELKLAIAALKIQEP